MNEHSHSQVISAVQHPSRVMLSRDYTLMEDGSSSMCSLVFSTLTSAFWFYEEMTFAWHCVQHCYTYGITFLPGMSMTQTNPHFFLVKTGLPQVIPMTMIKEIVFPFHKQNFCWNLSNVAMVDSLCVRNQLLVKKASLRFNLFLFFCGKMQKLRIMKIFKKPVLA